MFFFWLFPLVFVCVLAVWLTDLWQRRGRAVASSTWLGAVLLALLSAFGLALLSVVIDPWFEDNGVTQYIPWRERWLWACEGAGWLALVLVPLALGALALLRRRRAARHGV